MINNSILVVEDELALSQALLDNLEMAGYTVTTAFNGEEAIQKLKSVKPALILTDLLMPKKDGFELIMELKDSDAWRSIPIIVLSNLDGNDARTKVFAFGVKAYFIKSEHTLEEIVRAVGECITQNVPEKI
jgi:CheY-like chemotaxis protein